MTLVPIHESKDTLKKYGELWDEIRDLTRSIANNSNNNGDKYKGKN